MCSEKANIFKTVSWSANIVTRKINDITDTATDIVDQNRELEFSLTKDKSTDVSDTAQVLLFIRVIDENFEL